MSDIPLSRSPPDPGRSRAWLTLAAIAAAYVLYNFLLVWLGNILEPSGPEGLFYTILGGCAAQPMLLGLWASLGAGAALLRVPWVIAALTTGVYGIAIPFHWFNEFTSPRDVALGVGMMGLTVFIASAVVGAVIRGLSRHSVQRSFAGLAAAQQRFQFSVKYLLVLTTVCAVLLAIGGSLPRRADDLRINVNWLSMSLEVVVPALIILAVCLPTVFIAWIVLSPSPKERLLTIGATFWFVWTAILASIAASLGNGSPEPIGYLIAVQIGAALIGLASAVALHSGGYRLARRNVSRTTDKSAPADSVPAGTSD